MTTYYVLQGEKTGKNYAIYNRHKNKKFVLQQKQELEHLYNESINVLID